MPDLQTIVNALGGKREGRAWKCHCPAHADEHPSLSVSEGRDGKLLVKCWAGCSQDAVIKALRERGLWPEDLQVHQHNGNVPGPRASMAAPIHATAEAALAFYGFGKPDYTWDYCDGEGTVVGLVARWNRPDEKIIRPVSRCGDGWVAKGMPKPRPLYRLPEILISNDALYICEGEKCCDALVALGLNATTSSGGAKCAKHTDWSPLKSRNLFILGDNDTAGRDYVRDVVAIVRRLNPRIRIQLIELPDLPDAGDVVDFIDRRRTEGADDSLIRTEIESHVCAETVPEAVQVETSKRLKWVPFPVAVFPRVLREYVLETAKAIGCDPAMVAMHVLAVCGAAIGTTRCIKIKFKWREFPIIWAVLIARSGTMKSPAFDAAVEILQRVQTRRFQEHDDAVDAYEKELLEYEADLAAWKRTKGERGDPPTKPLVPQLIRYVLQETTIEALAPILQENARGVLVARDELSGWLNSFNQYKANGGSDVANWLEVFRGGTVTVDRKTGRRVIRVPRAAVSVCGTIQPGTLLRALTAAFFAAGLPARILMAQPPVGRKSWTDDDVDPKSAAAYERVIERLLDLEHDIDKDDQLVPLDIQMTPEARQLFIEFYNEFAADQHRQPDEDLAAAWAKIEAYAVRFALIFQLVGWASEECSPIAVDADSMRAGIILARWFAHETERVYATFGLSEAERAAESLVQLIQQMGGVVTPRDLMRRAGRKYPDSASATKALDDLVKADRGTWESPKPNAKGGNPSTQFRLADMMTDDTTPVFDPATRGSVICQRVDTEEMEFEGDGESGTDEA